MSAVLAPGAGGAPGPPAIGGHTEPARAALAARWSPRESFLYLALAAVLAVATLPLEVAPRDRSRVVAALGLLSVLALGQASTRLRTHRRPAWAATRHDPFAAVAVAAGVLVAPHLLRALQRDGSADLLTRHGWVVAGVAALVGSVGLLITLHDLTPGRAVDALFLAAIGAIGIGLVGWAAVERSVDADLPTSLALQVAGPVVLDLAVVGLALQALHLRARARQGAWLLLLGWTLVLVGDVSRLMAVVDGGSLDERVAATVLLLAVGLLGAAGLHPAATQAAEPVVGPLTRLPRSQVVLLGGAVVTGPLLLALGPQLGGLRSVALPMSALLSLLVVVYLVRLVQGRAILEHRAHHDELTGLANRTLFEDRAAVAIAHARRTGGHSAVLFLDLDRFKTVNDSLGHAMGNRLLQAVSKRLRAATRAEDTVARLGGDEFVVLLPHLDDPGDAAHVAAKVLAGFDDPFALNGHQLFASPSIGIAVFPGDGSDADALLENADIAMYRAKQQGRRRFCTYDRSMNDTAHERLALENQLHGAIERGELRLHYQPKIHLATGRVMGMEALLRWEHPELGLLQPSSFIPLAEETGLIVPIGEWALEEACRQNQEWSRAGFEPLVVAVNLSLRQFQHERIEDVTARVLRNTGLDPMLLELEVTESLAMQDPERIMATLADLKGLGVKCSIDDFGTGYSGLSHLMGFPIDKLKIDKSFVATIDTDREAPIVVAVVALARGLGLEVVAEGVETTEQLERLRELGCDEMQGFLFSRPVPPQIFEQLLMLEAVAPGPGRLAAPGRPHLRSVAG